MAKDLSVQIEIDKKELQQILNRLNGIGKKAEPSMLKLMDYAAAVIANHARANHFFVGVGVGSSKAAEANTFTFTNPDGSPRFKVRTGNLRNSIQEVPAAMEGKVAVAYVKAGMEYARKVEEGGPGTRAFPFLRPALEAARPDVLRYAKVILKDLMKG